MSDIKVESVLGAIEAWHMFFGYMVPMVAKAICKLKVPDILAECPESLTAAEIAARIPEVTSNGRDVEAAAEHLGRMMRFLVAHGIFKSHAAPPDWITRYSHTPGVSTLLVDNSSSVSGIHSVRPFLYANLYGPMLATFQHLPDLVTRGVSPCEAANGMGMYELTRSNPDVGRIFNAGMSSISHALMEDFMAVYAGFNGFSGTLVDVGGGIGSNAAFIVSRCPSISRAINYDKPHVVANAPTYPRVEHVGGDMFQNIPHGDIIFLKAIMHNWDDEACVNLLTNCHRALPKGGKVLIMDAFIDDSSNDKFHNIHLAMDILMMAHTKGKQRTMEQFKTILHASGFHFYNVIQLPCPDLVIEAFPNHNV